MLQYIIPPKVLLPYEKEIKDRIANNGHRGLIDNLQKFFTDSELLQVIGLYHLGSVDHRWVVYPYIDVDCRLRAMKTMRYYVDGHRARSKSAVSSLHALLKEEAILPALWKEHRCVFGEHLLRAYPNNPVIIVESEKTAIVCAMLFASYLWLATGGCDHFNSLVQIKAYLNTRTTYILPDKGQYNNWCRDTQKYKIKGKVLDYIEKKDVENNTDIADLFLSEKRDYYVEEFAKYLSSMEQIELAE